MLKIKQILFGAIVIGQACSALHAVDSDDLKQYGKIGASFASLLLAAYMGKVAYGKHRLIQNRKSYVEWVSGLPFNEKPSLREEDNLVRNFIIKLKIQRNMSVPASLAFLTAGAYGFSQSLK